MFTNADHVEVSGGLGLSELEQSPISLLLWSSTAPPDIADGIGASVSNPGQSRGFNGRGSPHGSTGSDFHFLSTW